VTPIEKAARAMQNEASRFRSPVRSYVEQEFRERWCEANMDKDFYDPGAPGSSADIDGALESWKILVRAVLQAIREPSEGMMSAAAETPGMKAASATMVLQQARGYPLDPAAFVDGSPLEQAWRASIDAALSE
jgi:hypothetical protein